MRKFVSYLYKLLAMFRPGELFVLWGEHGIGRTTFLYYLMAAASLRMPVVFLHHGHQYDRMQQAEFLRMWPEVIGYSYADINIEEALSLAQNGLLCVHNIHTLPYMTSIPGSFTPKAWWYLDWQLREKIKRLKHENVITIVIADNSTVPEATDFIYLKRVNGPPRRNRLECRGYAIEYPFLDPIPPRSIYGRGSFSAMSELYS